MQVESVTTGPVDDLLREHRSIFDQLHTIEELALHAEEHRGGWNGAMLQQLDTLTDELRFHFYREEAGGLFAELQARFPRYAGTIQRLRQEHLEILAQAQTIANAVRDHTYDAPTEAIAEQAHLLWQMIHHHEKTENELMLQAYSEDLGDAE